MNTIQKMMEDEHHFLIILLQKIEYQLKECPKTDDTLWVDHRKGAPQYYIGKRLNGNGPRKRTYIRKEDRKTAQALAQKTYLQNERSVVIRQLEIVNIFLAKYDEEALLRTYTDLSRDRQVLIEPLLLPEEAFVEQWQSSEFPKKEFGDDVPLILSERGERVRSKSEKIIADKLYMLNIPYHYEKPLLLKSGRLIYPDFTILNRRTRKTYYLEHFGKMDDPQYAESLVWRMDQYIKSGILPGEQLLFTMETNKTPLTNAILDIFIKTYFQ